MPTATIPYLAPMADISLSGYSADNCASVYNPLREDNDSDGVGKACCCDVMGNLDDSADRLVTMGGLTVLIDHLFIRLAPLPTCG